MTLRASVLSLGLATLTTFTSSRLARADHDGGELNIHNQTGHEVVAFLFTDDKVHLDEAGGTQFAHLKQGESATAHVPQCKFSVLLVDHDDVWHAEFHDCHTTDKTFTKDTGHARKKH